MDESCPTKVVTHEVRTGNVYNPSSVTRAMDAKYVQIIALVRIAGGKQNHIDLSSTNREKTRMFDPCGMNRKQKRVRMTHAA